MICKKSYGKINLSLEVLGKRSDGYHNIDTLMNKIDLYDEMIFELRDDDNLIIRSDNENFPTDNSNLIYKAWEILSSYKKTNRGIDVFVTKNIPIAAGLAGGTSNGVETMKALNELWDLGFSNEELKDLSKALGADSNFFFYEDLVRAQGIGDNIIRLKKLDPLCLLIINIGKPISSKEIYENMTSYSNEIVENIVDNIDDFTYLWNHAFNSMEEVSFKIYPVLEDIKKKLNDSGANLSLMSGSGPSIFGLYEDTKLRDKAYEELKNDYKYVIKSKLK